MYAECIFWITWKKKVAALIPFQMCNQADTWASPGQFSFYNCCYTHAHTHMHRMTEHKHTLDVPR